MIRNYFKIAWRNILKIKGMFSMNITGLAIGTASCLIIMLFVLDELSYERFQENFDEIARIVFNEDIDGEKIREAVVMAPVAPTLKEVADATRIRMKGSSILIVEDRIFRDSKFAYVDPNFFDIFTLPVNEGNSGNPLDTPHSRGITKSEARKLFGKQQTDMAQKLQL